jgi:hypothetical protein
MWVYQRRGRSDAARFSLKRFLRRTTTPVRSTKKFKFQKAAASTIQTLLAFVVQALNATTW